MRRYIDERNPDKEISESDLKKEYGKSVYRGDTDPDEATFRQWLNNCMRENNGTLAVAKLYGYEVHETRSCTVQVVAGSKLEAERKIDDLYSTGRIPFTFDSSNLILVNESEVS